MRFSLLLVAAPCHSLIYMAHTSVRISNHVMCVCTLRCCSRTSCSGVWARRAWRRVPWTRGVFAPTSGAPSQCPACRPWWTWHSRRRQTRRRACCMLPLCPGTWYEGCVWVWVWAGETGVRGMYVRGRMQTWRIHHHTACPDALKPYLCMHQCARVSAPFIHVIM